MKLLLDEDSEAKALIQRLLDAGHDVATIGQLGQRGEPDATVLNLAKHAERVLLTRNCSDFKRLHDADSNHAGILAVYHERDPRKDMSYSEIAHAIDTLQQVGAPLLGAFICLNQWRG